MFSGAAASSGSLLQSSDRVQTGYKTTSHSLNLYCVTRFTHSDGQISLVWNFPSIGELSRIVENVCFARYRGPPTGRVPCVCLFDGFAEGQTFVPSNVVQKNLAIRRDAGISLAADELTTLIVAGRVPDAQVLPELLQ